MPSLGKSIAKALGIEYIRISLGGLRDESDTNYLKSKKIISKKFNLTHFDEGSYSISPLYQKNCSFS